jgi:hypothetical protein
MRLVISTPQTLRSNEYFGQYGKIIKVVVNRNHMSGDRQNGSASAYITYSKKEDARAAIQAVDGFWLDGRLIRSAAAYLLLDRCPSLVLTRFTLAGLHLAQQSIAIFSCATCPATTPIACTCTKWAGTTTASRRRRCKRGGPAQGSENKPTQHLQQPTPMARPGRLFCQRASLPAKGLTRRASHTDHHDARASLRPLSRLGLGARTARCRPRFEQACRVMRTSMEWMSRSHRRRYRSTLSSHSSSGR